MEDSHIPSREPIFGFVKVNIEPYYEEFNNYQSAKEWIGNYGNNSTDYLIVEVIRKS